MKKSLSLVLAVIMVISVIPMSLLSVGAQTPQTGTFTVIAGSDFQYDTVDRYGLYADEGVTYNSSLRHEAGKRVTTAILNQMADDGITVSDGFLFTGDYDVLMPTDSNRDTVGGMNALKAALTESAVDFTNAPKFLLQGNHEPNNGDFGTNPTGNNDPKNGAYGVFMINQRDFQWKQNANNVSVIKDTAESLRRYLNDKIAVNYTAPIFVLSHLPLHYSMRTKNDGDSSYANYIFDVLNDAGSKGLNIIFLFGHNHSNGWDDYLGGSKVFLTKGDSINIAQASKTVFKTETLNFTYLNSGYLGYYKNHNSATGTQNSDNFYNIGDLTMTAFVFDENGIEIKRYNNSGVTDLKKTGIKNYYKNESGYDPVTTTVSSPVNFNLTYVNNTSYEIPPVVPRDSGESNPEQNEPSLIRTFSKVNPTNAAQLVDGRTYVIGSTKNSVEYAFSCKPTGSLGYLEPIQVTVSNNKINTADRSIMWIWDAQANNFRAAGGPQEGKYFNLDNDYTGPITFVNREEAIAYTLNESSHFYFTNPQGSKRYLYYSGSNSAFRGHMNACVINFYEVEDEMYNNTWTRVGGETIGGGSSYTTPDSGMYSTASNASAESIVNLTKTGDMYTVTNVSGKNMNISNDGAVTWTSTAQNLTLTSDASGNITAFNPSGVQASSVLNGVTIYNATSHPGDNVSEEYYGEDKSGVNNNVKYIIVAADAEEMLYYDGTTLSSVPITIEYNNKNEEIVIPRLYGASWKFNGNGEGRILHYNANNKFLNFATTDGGAPVVTGTSTKNSYPLVSTSGTFYTLSTTANGKRYYLFYENGQWVSKESNTTTNEYQVRLYKFWGSITVPGPTTYTTSGSFTPTEISNSSQISHYVRYTSNEVVLPLDSNGTIANTYIRNSTAKLMYSLDPSGTNAEELSIENEALSFDFSAISFDECGVYSVPVYYTDNTASSPARVLIGHQTVVIYPRASLQSISIDRNYGAVAVNSNANKSVDANIVYTYKDGSTKKVPITLGMLIDYSGNYDVMSLAETNGEYQGLGVFYDMGEGYWFDNFTLRVIYAENYPDYPNQGSVKVNKQARGVNFQTEGITQVELSATGVPSNLGIDVVLMVDASSSMTFVTGTYNDNGVTKEVFGDNSMGSNGTYSGRFYDANGQLISNLSINQVENRSTRLQSLRSSVTALINRLATPDATTGEARDISMAIAQFNGYSAYKEGDTDRLCYVSTNDHLNGAKLRDTQTTGAVLTGSKNATADAFVNVGTLKTSFNPQENIVARGGTNYDYAFDKMYDLIAAKQAANEANGEHRQVIAIFMSDGAPFMYNYFGSDNRVDNWNDWLQGKYTSLAEVRRNTTSSNAHFYNGPGNSHRTADAIKGDVDKKYAVINKMCPAGTVDVTGDGVNDPYMTEVYGLGAKMYSIGFCLTVDYSVTLETNHYVLEKCASDPTKYFTANSATALNDAFLEIAEQTVHAGTDAYFVDTLGSAFDLCMSSTYVKNGITYNYTETPKIQMLDYTVYTLEDYESGRYNISYDDIGNRTGEVRTIETVTFNESGTEAYSNRINNGQTNIFIDGVIRAKTFIFNTTANPIMIDTDGDGRNDHRLDSETFYWNLEIIPDTEYALSYYVYLSSSMEGMREAGSYATNMAAILYYDNYLGNECRIETVSPILPWQAATITYEFYLVNSQGQPVNRSGQVVPFENRVILGNKQTETIMLNTITQQTSFDLEAFENIPEGYRLFNENAGYKVTISSGSTPSSAEIHDDKPIVTTYFYDDNGRWKGNGEIPSNKVTDYTKTNVAFAVLLNTSILPDTVVMDYGLPISIHVLANDLCLPANAVINSIGTVTPTQCNYPLSSAQFAKASTLSMENGNVSIGVSGKEVIYTPKNATMNDEEVFYYEVFYDGNFYYGMVTVIPATNIYYEDSFFTFIDGQDGYNWTQVGETYQNVLQAEDRPGKFSLIQYDANNNYGRDNAYNDSVATYSLGSAMKATVDLGSVNKEPKAEFTFCGTGFDLFSVTTNKSGTAVVNVTGISEGNDYNKSYIINTYYGYSYGRLYLDGSNTEKATVTMSPTYVVDDVTHNNAPLYETEYQPGFVVPDEDETLVTVNGKVYSTKPYLFTEAADSYRFANGWILSNGEEIGLYQVPVVSIPGNSQAGVSIPELPYGIYKVTVTPKYSKGFDKTGDDQYTFCVDGIRIYNPAGKGDQISEVVDAAYEKDRESNPHYDELRDAIILDTDNFLKVINADDTTVGGALFIDGISALNSDISSSLNKFKETGPNNEVYLSDGQAVAFKPVINDCPTTPASFQLGMKVNAQGVESAANATIKVVVSDTENNRILHTYIVPVNGSTEQYYDFSSYISWMNDPEMINKYNSKYTIVLLNDSDTLVSVTSVKWTYLTNTENSTETPTLRTYANDPEPTLTFEASKDTLDFAQTAISSEYKIVGTYGVKLNWHNKNVKVGDKARLIITTTQNVTSVSVGNKVLTKYVDNADGTRTWKYDFTVTKDSGKNYDVVVTDNRGRESKKLITEKLIVEGGTTQEKKPEDTKLGAFIKKLIDNFIQKLLGKLRLSFGGAKR